LQDHGNRWDRRRSTSARWPQGYASIEIAGDDATDVVNFNGAITFAADRGLTVSGVGTVNLPTAASDIAASGNGWVNITALKNIALETGSRIATQHGALILEANQQTPATEGSFVGVRVANATIEATGIGPVTVNGNGGDGASGQYGVYVLAGGKIRGGTSAVVEVAGRGGENQEGHGNHGVVVDGAGSEITSGGAEVRVTGNGGVGSKDFNYGVEVRGGGTISAEQAGFLIVTGFGGNQWAGDGDHNVGVSVHTGGQIFSANGEVFVFGFGNGQGSNGQNYGVHISSGGVITSVGTGDVFVSGEGGNRWLGNGSDNYGVYVTDANSQITSAGAAVSVLGNGGGREDSIGNHGVHVSSGGAISAGAAGSVTVVGEGGNPAGTGGSNYGVLVDSLNGAGSQITSGAGGGDVSVTGTGRGAGGSWYNFGVFVTSAGKITAGGAGTVTVAGQGGNTFASGGVRNHGVYVSFGGAQITSTGGPVTVSGTGGGTNGGSENYGVYVSLNGAITAGGTGKVTVTGHGGSDNSGVAIANSGARITSSGGDIDITGVPGGDSSHGISIASSGQVLATTGSPTVTLTADRMNFSSSASVDAGSNLVKLRPETSGREINLGEPGSSSQLGLTNAQLNSITAGTLHIGDADSGPITVSADIARAAPTNMVLASGGDIVLSGGQIDTGGGALVLNPGVSPAAVKPIKTGTDVTASILSFGSDLAIVIDGPAPDTQYTQLNVVGSVDLTGVDLKISGSYLPTAVDTFVIVVNDGADAIIGTFNDLAEGATVDVNGTDKRITYFGGDGNDVELLPSGPGAIRGMKFHDLNGNGVRDSGEPGLDGWTIELVDAATGEVVAEQITYSTDLDGDGSIDPETEQGLYHFPDVLPGEYLVREVLQEGWQQTYPVAGGGGKIAFVRSEHGFSRILVIDADGSNQQEIVAGSGIDTLSWSPDGDWIVYRAPGSGSGYGDLFLVDTSGFGAPLALTTTPDHDEGKPDWSPDGSLIVFARSPTSGGSEDIFVIQPDGTGLTQLTSGPGRDADPAWSPDGTKIAFTRFEPVSGSLEILVMNADGSGPLIPVGSGFGAAWSPDGTKIAYYGFDGGDLPQILIVDADGSGMPVLLTDDGSENTSPTWSGDGSSIIFSSDVGGSRDLYVIPADGSGPPVALTGDPANDWGASFLASGSGSGAGGVHAVTVIAGQTLEDVDFGNRLQPLGSIHGFKFEDVNGDGVYQPPVIAEDNGDGTADLPAGAYASAPNQPVLVIDGLPPGTTLEGPAVLDDFSNIVRTPDPVSGGDVQQFDARLRLEFSGTGDLATYHRPLSLDVEAETRTAPRTPDDPVQAFDTEMIRLEGELTGDPDFDLLRITAGSDFGLPSPGHTTLTRLPGGDWAVDSFFDITYRIDFVGAPSGPFAGQSGSTTGTIRMSSGGNDRPLGGITFVLAGDVDGDGILDVITQTTDEQGEFRFIGLHPGWYEIWEDVWLLPDAVVPTTDTTVALYVGGGQELVWREGAAMLPPESSQQEVPVGGLLMFGNALLGEISGWKFEDLNGNGVWDDGEPGLAGWPITLTGVTGQGWPVTMTAVTMLDDPNTPEDETGWFRFTGLWPGEYHVDEEQMTPWDQSLGVGGYEVTLASGGNVQDLNFGNVLPGSIHGYKFEDLNGNGQFDAGEVTVPGVTFTLTGTTGWGWHLKPRTVVSDEKGQFRFDDLWPGDYTVTEMLPPGTVSTTSPSVQVPIVSGQHVVAEPGQAMLATPLVRHVFTGTVTSSERGWSSLVPVGSAISGFFVYDRSLPDRSSDPTEGAYRLDPPLPVGPSRVMFTAGGITFVNDLNERLLYVVYDDYVYPGQSPIDDFSTTFQHMVASPGSELPPDLMAGPVQFTFLLRDSTATAFSSDALPDALDLSAFTDFVGFVDGTSHVDGWSRFRYSLDSLNVAAGDGYETVNSGLAFGNRTLGGVIEGRKFHDLNGNGIQDPGEPGLEGWTITLTGYDSARNLTSMTVQTMADDPATEDVDEAGWYRFENVPAGTHVIHEEMPLGWQQTLPAASGFQFTRLVDSDTPIPGGSGNFIGLGAPSLVGNDLAFEGYGPDGQRGFYSLINGTLQVVADLNTPRPGGSGNFGGFLSGQSFDGQHTAFRSFSGIGVDGVYAQIDGTLVTIADTNDFEFFFSEPSIDDGTVSFRGRTGTHDGIYVGNSAPFTVIADSSTAIPGGTGNFSFLTDNAYDGSQVVFVGTGFGQQGVYLGDGTSVVAVADKTTLIPGAGGVAFQGFQRPVVENGLVAFEGSGPDTRGIYTAQGGTVSVVADTNTIIPDGPGNFEGLFGPSLDGGHLVFLGSVSFKGFGNNFTGLYTTRTGGLARVIDVADALDGRAIESLSHSREGLSGNALAFTVYHSDGSSAIYLATWGEPNQSPAVPTTRGHFVSLNDGEVSSGNDFGNRLQPPAIGEVRGTKFEDLNGNGVQDPGEPGLGGWTIFADLNDNGLLDPEEPSTVTAADGTYVLSDVPAGLQIIAELPQSGWRQSIPVPPLAVTPAPPVVPILERTGVANTVVSSDITSDTTWTKADGPYLVQNSITIASDARLMVEPGVEVLFSSAARLTVDGELAAVGTAADPILFTSSSATPARNDWAGILVRNPLGGRLSLQYVTLEYAGTALALQCCGGAAPRAIQDTVFRHNTVAVGGYSGSNLLIERSIFDSNAYAITQADKQIYQSHFVNNEYGLFQTERVSVFSSTFENNQTALYGGRGTVQYSRIVHNAVGVQPSFEGFTLLNNEIAANGIGLILATTTTIPPVQHNNIHGNTTFNVQYSGPGDRQLASNYWGTTDQTTIDAGILDGRDGSLAGLVHYEPVLTAPAPTGPERPGTHSVVVLDGEVSAEIHFGSFRFASLSGNKYDDVNNDGARGDNEPYLQGWTVYLDLNGNGQLDIDEPRSRTDSGGNYSFVNLKPGTYVVREVPKNGWNVTDPAAGFHEVALISNQSATGLIFGNHEPGRPAPAEIQGRLFHDLNNNGQHDAGEPPLGGWIVYLDLNGNRQKDNGEPFTVTDANGEYRFTGLPAGTYTVRQQLQTHWQEASPPAEAPPAPAPPPAAVKSGVANTTFSGGIFDDTVWRAVDGPFHVTGNVVVYPGATLTIEPGVQVWFDASVQLHVRGNLTAHGTADAPILFTSSAEEPVRGGWGGVAIQNTLGGQATFKFTTIEYAATALHVSCCGGHAPGAIAVQDSVLRHNQTGFGGYTGTPILVTRTHFHDNTFAITSADKHIYDSVFTDNEYGLYQTERVSVYHSVFNGNQTALWGGRGTVQFSHITGNGIGVRPSFEGFTLRNNEIASNDVGLLLPTSSFMPPIEYNNIHANTDWNVRAQGSFNRSLSGNYWGTTDSAAIAASIQDNSDNPALGTVTFNPFLTESAVTAPPAVGQHMVTVAQGQVLSDVDFGNLYLPPGTLSATLDNGILTITDVSGGAAGNQTTLSLDGANLVVTDASERFTVFPSGATLSNDNRTLTIPLSLVTGSLIIDLAGGDDTLTVDFSGGNPIPAGGLSFDGGEGGFDSLAITGGAFHTSTFTYVNASDGSIALDVDGDGTMVSTITYVSLEPIFFDIASNVVELIYTGGDETITVSDAGDGQTTAVSTLGELTTFNNPSELLRVVATGGTDTIHVNSLAAGYASIEIAGDDVTDMLNFNGTITFAADHGLTVSDVGTVNLPNAASDIAATGTGSVSLTALRNIALASGSSLAAVDGDITLTANPAGTATGNFVGIHLVGANITSSGAG
jgi:Tol biopolymer transport system component